MRRLLFCSILLLLGATPAFAAVEIIRGNQLPVAIQEVYLRSGVLYLPADELLAAVGLSGQWSSTEHLYKMKIPGGTATLAPGNRSVRLDGRVIRLAAPPLFIDNRLRFPEDLVYTLFPAVLNEKIQFRDLNPASAGKPQKNTMDSIGDFISLLLRKDKGDRPGPALRAILIDPGHGGADAGSIGVAGITEKTVTLEISRRLEKRLKMRLDIPVYLSRDGDYTVAAAQRLEAVGRAEIDAILLLHAQSALSPLVEGINLVVRPQDEGKSGSPETGEGSLRFARHLAEALRQAGLTVHNIIRAPLPPLGRGNLPTVLVELGYLSNEGDRTLLREIAGQDRLAEALFTGIRKFADEERKEQENAKQ